jgi:hypothetical protein
VACEDKTFDMVAGGSNGVVYLYRRGVLTVFIQALRGKVQCLAVINDRVCIGGTGGKLKILDGRTLITLHDFSLLGVSATAAAVRPGSAAASGRSKSAGGVRPTSRGGVASVVTAKSGARVLGHAAGGVIRPRPAGDILSAANDNYVEPESLSGSKVVTGIAVVRGHGRGAAQGTYLIVSLGTGKVVRVDIGSASTASTRPGSATYSQQASVAPYYGKDLFHFHTGAVYGMAADVTSGRRLLATVCDDRKLMVWDVEDCVLLAKAVTQTQSRCVHLDKTNRFLAVGSTSGSLTIHYLSGQLEGAGGFFRIDEVRFHAYDNV